MSAPVFVFISGNFCGACHAFRPEWDKLCKDSQVTSLYHFREFSTGWFGEELVLHPPNFLGFEQIPFLCVCSGRDYNKSFDINDPTINKNEDAVNYTQYTSYRSAELIKQWLLEQYPKLIGKT